jgi:CheY-like chemotaxis protein
MRAEQNSEQRELPGTLLQTKPHPPRQILVVDDEPLICRLNAEVLIDAGYHVDVAADGVVAWDMLQLKRYDLLITDNQMPKVSGVELVKKLHLASICLPVIMATSALPVEELKRLKWLPIALVLLKPYTITELLNAVDLTAMPPVWIPAPFTPPTYWQIEPPANQLRR